MAHHPTDHVIRFITETSWQNLPAVGVHPVSGAEFRGPPVFAPSGVDRVKGIHRSGKLIILHDIDITRQRTHEKADFDYAADFFDARPPTLRRFPG